MILTSEVQTADGKGTEIINDFLIAPTAAPEEVAAALLLEPGFPRNYIREIDMRPRGDHANGKLMRPIRPLTVIHDKGAIGRRAITFDPSSPSAETIGYVLAPDLEAFMELCGNKSAIASVIYGFFGAGRGNKKYRVGVPTGTSGTIEQALINSGILGNFSDNAAAGLASLFEMAFRPISVVSPCSPITVMEDRFSPQLDLKSFRAHAAAIAIRDAIEATKFGIHINERTKDFYLDTFIESLSTSFRQMMPTLRAAINLDRTITHGLELIARYVINPDDPTALPKFMESNSLLDSLSTNLTVVMMALEQRRTLPADTKMMSLADWSTEDHERALNQIDRLIMTSPRYSVVNLSDMRSIYGHETIISSDKSPRAVVVYQNASIDGRVQITDFIKADDSENNWYQVPAKEYEAIFTPFMTAVKDKIDTKRAAQIATHTLQLAAEAIPHPIITGISVSEQGLQEYAASIARDVYISVDPGSQNASLVYQVDVSHLNFPKLAFGSLYLTSDPAAMLMLMDGGNTPTMSMEGRIQTIPDECRGHIIAGSLKKLTEPLSRGIDVEVVFDKQKYQHHVSLAEITNMWFSKMARITRSPLTSVVGSAYAGTIINLTAYLRAIAEVTEDQLDDVLYREMYTMMSLGDQIGDINAEGRLVNTELDLDTSIGNLSISAALELKDILFHPTVKYLSRSVLWKIIESIPSSSERLKLKNSMVHAKYSIELHKSVAMVMLVRLGIVSYDLMTSVLNLFNRTDVTMHMMRVEGSIAGPQ